MRYTIEKNEPLVQEYLIILLPQQGLTLQQWYAKSISLLDQEILKQLAKEEAAFQQRQVRQTSSFDKIPLNKIHLSSPHSLLLLEQMAQTHNLYYDEKQLVIDFFTPVHLHYEGDIKEDQSLVLTTYLSWRDTTILLNDCDLIGIGKRPWFIKGIALRSIVTPLSGKELIKISSTKEIVLQGTEKLAFLRELEEDEEGPRLKLTGKNNEIVQQSTPLPLLILKDRFGAFADLWMVYSEDLKTMIQNPVNDLKAHNNTTRIKRQLSSEKNWEKDLLETDFILKNSGTSHYYCPTHLVAKSLIFLLEIGWSIQDYRGQQVVRQSDNHFTVEEKDDKICIKGKIKFKEYEADLQQVLGAFNRRESFVQLSGNCVGLLEYDVKNHALQDLAQESEIVGSSVEIKKNQFAAFVDFFPKSALTSTLQHLSEKMIHFQQIEQTLPGYLFNGTLRPYQQTGLNWLSFLNDYALHGILADDMGLGKTVQILAFLSTLTTALPHLIIMPTSLLFNWRKEIEKFLPSFTCLVHQGHKRTKSSDELKNFSIILTSYGTLRADVHLLTQISYHCVILDEAQVIKNSQTLTAQAVYELKAQTRLCITGTPIENRMEELWSHFRFLIPELLGDLKDFQVEIESASADTRYLQRIKKKIKPFILRRTKKEVLQDLPERIDQIVWVEMDTTQRKIYEQFLTGYQKNLIKKVEVDGSSAHRMEILEAILRLRQICCHPLLISSQFETTDEYISAKFDALLQDLATISAENKKVLVYSQFSGMLKLMVQKAQSNAWNFSYLDGTTQNREKVVEDFQNFEGSMIFFVSLKAGGVGLNLTAADYVILYDPWWNEAAEEQAINRAHRIGRKDVVIAKRFVMVDTIEEKIMKLKELKKDIVTQIFDDTTNSTQVSLEDLAFLLK